MKMKCVKAMVYNGRRFKAGEEFEAASPNDVRVLESIKKAQRMHTPSGAAAWAPVVEEVRRKRTYTRRDMVAETPQAVQETTPPWKDKVIVAEPAKE